jgi:hypothetical protein
MDFKFEKGHYKYRFFDSFDDESRNFENKLLQNFQMINLQPEGLGPIRWPEIVFWQESIYLENKNQSYFVLQTESTLTGKLYQFSIIVSNSKIKYFKTGRISYWIPILGETCIIDQIEILKTLKELCRSHLKVMNLRIHAYAPGRESQESAQNILNNAGFSHTNLQAPAMTRLIDLRPALEDLQRLFTSKVRGLIKNKKPEIVNIASIDTFEEIPFIQHALNDSFRRSSSQNYYFDFESLFNIKRKAPNNLLICGFYFNNQPNQPLAFAMSVLSSNIAEYSIAGSRSDNKLRQFPFNYILLWDLIVKSKINGADFFDMGGITDETPEDLLAGISYFKRRFPGVDIKIGLEYIADLSPIRSSIFLLLQRIKKVIS